jgi:hypothetical protein
MASEYSPFANGIVLTTGWAVMLCVSMLPNALLHELAGGSPAWLVWAKIGLLAVPGGIAFFWTPLRRLRNYILILLAIFVGEEGISRLTTSMFWQGWFGGPGALFARSMLGTQLGRLIVALWNAALFFGIGHYFGVPYGVIGVVMATFLGWILGKAMLETRGLFWSWSIHFVQDVLIFSFMAAGSIAAGG